MVQQFAGATVWFARPGLFSGALWSGACDLRRICNFIVLSVLCNGAPAAALRTGNIVLQYTIVLQYKMNTTLCNETPTELARLVTIGVISLCMEFLYEYAVLPPVDHPGLCG